MSVTENKANLQRAVDSWNDGNLEGYLQLYDASVVLHGYPPGLPSGVEGARIFYNGFWAAFPSPRLTFEDLISEGDKVAIRFTVRTTHNGDFMGIPPTGKDVEVSGMTILRFAGGRCVERWNQVDMLGLMQQLGAAASPGQT